MVLDKLTDGASRHLSAYDESTRQLIYILCLPLVDGVYASLLVSGAVTTFSDIVTVSLTVFSGAGALAVLYANSESVEDARNMVLKAAPVLVLGSVTVGLVSPIYSEIFRIPLLKYAAGLTLLSIAGNMAEISLAEKLPPHAVILTGMVLSLQTPSALSFSTAYLSEAVLTSLLTLSTLLVACQLKRYDLNLRYIRIGGASALTIISASIFFSTPSEPSLIVLGMAFLASLK